MERHSCLLLLIIIPRRWSLTPLNLRSLLPSVTSTNTNRSEDTNMSRRPAPARVTWAPDSVEAGSSHRGVNGLQRRPLCHNPPMLPKCFYLLIAFNFCQFVWRMHSPNSYNRGVGGLCLQGEHNGLQSQLLYHSMSPSQSHALSFSNTVDHV